MSEEMVNLGSLVRIRGGKRLPAGTALQESPSFHPYIRVRDVGARKLPSSGLEYVPDEVFPSISRYIVETNDVVISIVGTIGALSLVDERYEKASLTENCARLTGLNKDDAHYLYYFLISRYGQEEIRKGTVGAVQPKLPLYNIEKIQIRWPKQEHERAHIAHLLGTLDDKIELNRRMNETLEAIARAMFKSWFVDFDPVRAKMNGEPPESICQRLGLTPDLLSLFPDRLVDSEFDEIPEGWEVGTIDDHCHLNAKSWTAKTIPQEVHYIDLANTKEGIISEVQVFPSSEVPSRARRILRAGDTIVGTVRPGNRSFALIGEGSPALTGSTGFAVLSPKRQELRELVYFLATDEENIHRLSRLADGAAYPAVRPEIVTAGASIIPCAEVIDAFHGVVAPMIDSVISNCSNSDLISNLRDALLPKLLAGELCVDIATEIQEAI